MKALPIACRRESDVFAADLSPATVVTMYLLSSVVAKLEPKLLRELKPGTRIVVHDYGFPDWSPIAASTSRSTTICTSFQRTFRASGA